ncbi:MAG TPA: hypothetical protein VLS89_14855 [Candidatus Nanopelagicales bacterium]|nr:hypothetical protein [Candidatus Nanopelagicales bacterium]
MKINIIDRLAEGRPLLLVPEGLLLRWPRDRALPEVGDPFEGQTIRLARPDHLRYLVTLLHGNALERCDAAQRLPPDLVITVYSRSMANNMRRVARDMTPGLRAHIRALLQDGCRVSTRQLIAAVSVRTEADQLDRWNRIVG